MKLASEPVGAPQVMSYINLGWLVNANLSQIQRGRKWKSVDELDLTPKPKQKHMGEQEATPGKFQPNEISFTLVSVLPS